MYSGRRGGIGARGPQGRDGAPGPDGRAGESGGFGSRGRNGKTVIILQHCNKITQYRIT